jgi:ATP-dependent DNA helicase PIF1
MFHNAVRNHNAAVASASSTSPPSTTYKQVSLTPKLGQSGSLHKPTTRPLVSGTNQNGVGLQRPTAPVTHGIKRTSSGLAKQLTSQEEMFNYPTLNIAAMEKENKLPPAFHTTSRTTSINLATALFNDDDFDSDIDLDVEDPATKGTVTYPTLTRMERAGTVASRDSGYQSRPPSAYTKLEPNSSQPIPWSSSPAEHFKTPPKPTAPPKTKRRQLPWAQVSKTQPSQEPEEQIEDGEEDSISKKLKLEKTVSTPAPKKPSFDIPWNTTASAVKQQQQSHREMVKAKSKTNKGTEEEVETALKKKKKDAVPRMFLSEEQQHVLNLVTESKKSVFFTGSAGTIILA